MCTFNVFFCTKETSCGESIHWVPLTKKQKTTDELEIS